MCAFTLAVSAVMWHRLVSHLLEAGAEERMAFGYCSAASASGKSRIVLNDSDFPEDGEYAVQHATGVVLSAAKTIPYLLKAAGSGAFLDAHSHPHSAFPRPSSVDDMAAASQFRALQATAPGGHLVRLILSTGGRVWAGVHQQPNRLQPIDRIDVLGPDGLRMILPVNSIAEAHPFPPTDERTLDALGEEALSRLHGLTVGVIGVGGVGAMVARLLAGLVGRLVLVDGDDIAPSNVPRVWYAQARSRGKKVFLAGRALRRAFPRLAVHAIPDFFPSEAAENELAAADFLFVCPDHNAVRVSASRYAAAGMLPMIEVGCGGRTMAGRLSALGHHVRLQVPGGPCVSCNGLDLTRLEDPGTTAMKRRFGYLEGAEEMGGELAPLTTRAAADSVDMFLRYCTGYGGGAPLHLYCDAMNWKLIDLSDRYAPRADCPICGHPDQGEGASPHAVAILSPPTGPGVPIDLPTGGQA
jgi:molybdopterin/thiamine biosynthesis adenylyltransferase